MRCCVPFCKNTSKNVYATKGTKGISFHAFPSEVGLRAAWLRALGKQDSHLPDSAVVCSQHFLNDDINETESGLVKIRTDAIPSTVQVCMICLDTDSKLFLMSKHKLDEAYEKLTGHALCDPGNLKQTVCVQCAQRLINCSQFRDKCLRARALMMDLVEKHELITRQHVKKINRTTNKLTSNIVVVTLGPDPCNLYILEHPSEDKQTDSETTIHIDIVKKEESYDSIFIDENMEVANEDVNDADYINDEFVADNEEYEHETQDPFKYESAPFQCTICFEEFIYENAYMQHMIMHIQNGAGDGECAASQECEPHTVMCEPHTAVSSDASLLTESRRASHKTRDDTPPSPHSAQTAVAPFSARLATNNENKAQAEEADAVQRRKQKLKINNGELDNQSFDTSSRTNVDRLTNCVVKLYDVLKKPKENVPVQDSPCHINTASKDFGSAIANQNEDIESVTEKVNANNRDVSRTSQIKTNCSNNDVDESFSFIENNFFTCDVCKNMFERKRLLVKHIKTHTEVKPFTRKYNRDKLENKSDLTSATHMRSHGEKLNNACKLCNWKCTQNSHLADHMKTHTGETPYTCNLCSRKFVKSGNLKTHMRTHTGEKPYSCNLCSCKFAQSCTLKRHMRTHTGEKPYTCNLCSRKFAQIGNLYKHMKTHTGEKPYHCKLCSFKFARSGHLKMHMRTHTGEKSFYCQLCKYKCAQKGSLVQHMRTHTGEKPYTCNLCSRKFACSGNLYSHLRTHTGEKPYACKLCNCKFAQSGSLLSHIRTHIGEKLYICQLCGFKFVHSANLKSHMKRHTGEKPYTCNLCSYKFVCSNSLKNHMKTHTGEKPYTCNLCSCKFAQSGTLKRHMKTHTGEKSYTCNLCSCKFAHNYHLKSHMKTHTGEKPYHCKLCSCKFARSRYLKIHMRTHTGERPYTCNLCSRKFARNDNLKSHMKTHTGQK